MTIYRGLVVGAGQMAALYDQPGDERTLTHCHAFQRNPRTELAAVVDTDAERARAAGDRWGVPFYASLEQALAAERPDIVSVCTPTRTHAAVVEAVVAASPGFVFLEKPVGSSAAEAAAVARALKGARVPCMVNYPRNFDPVVRDLSSAAASGRYGAFITAVVYYSKGIRNNGSHLIHLLHDVLGRIASHVVLDRKVDYDAADPTLDLFLRMERGGTVHLVAVDERAYSVIDTTFLFSDARVHFRNFGLEVCVSRKREDPVFPGYWDLESQDLYVQTGLGRSLETALAQIVGHLDGGVPFDSSLEAALRTEAAIDAILNSGVPRT